MTETAHPHPTPQLFSLPFSEIFMSGCAVLKHEKLKQCSPRPGPTVTAPCKPRKESSDLRLQSTQNLDLLSPAWVNKDLHSCARRSPPLVSSYECKRYRETRWMIPVTAVTDEGNRLTESREVLYTGKTKPLPLMALNFSMRH